MLFFYLLFPTGLFFFFTLPAFLPQRVIKGIKRLIIPILKLRENLMSYHSRAFVRQIFNLPLQSFLPFYFLAPGCSPKRCGCQGSLTIRVSGV